MTDPRNIAHDKKVQQEKKHRGEEIAPGADETPQPGRKPHHEHPGHDEAADAPQASTGSSHDTSHETAHDKQSS